MHWQNRRHSTSLDFLNLVSMLMHRKFFSMVLRSEALVECGHILNYIFYAAALHVHVSYSSEFFHNESSIDLELSQQESIAILINLVPGMLSLV